MDLEIVDPNTCIRGCCRSDLIPLHLLPSSYSLSNLIARGAESGVYQAILKGKNVAAKKPILSTSEDIDKFHKQLQILCKVDHPGIAKLIAAHARPPNYLFFFEFYGMGDLSGKLHVEEWSPSVDQALTIIYQLAKSLQYLHNLGIIHRDVKAANVLLDINLHPHLADFGLAQYKYDLKQVSIENWRSSGKPTGGFHKKNMVGTLIYMAPEVLRKEIHTEKSDVYSFGVTINELLTGVVPYTDLRAAAQAHTVLEMNYTEQQLTSAVVSEGLRPNLPDLETLGAPPGLLSLIQRCWATNPQDRPSFDDVVLELDPILESRNGRKLEITCAKPSISLGNQMSNPMTYQKKVHWYSEGENFSRRSRHAEYSGVRIWPDLLTNGFAYQPVLCWGSFATCGRRETMEDAHFLMPHLCSEKDIHVFGIFDGHRGAEAAEFSNGALPGLLRSLGSTNSPSDALLEAFVETDAAFRHELQSHRKSKRATPKNWNPGCTAIVALIVRNKLFVANAGDCRAILCRASSAYSLSKDHIASCVEERERVMKAGGLVKWQVDTWRVGEAALQVTRSIGDDDLKPAVTAEPEITETMLSSMDEYMDKRDSIVCEVAEPERTPDLYEKAFTEVTGPDAIGKQVVWPLSKLKPKSPVTVKQ